MYIVVCYSYQDHTGWVLIFQLQLVFNKRREITVIVPSGSMVVFEDVLIKAFGKKGIDCPLIRAIAPYEMPSSWFPRSKTYLSCLKFYFRWEIFRSGRFLSSLPKALGDIFFMPLLVINVLCNISSFGSYFHPWHAEELRKRYVMWQDTPLALST